MLSIAASTASAALGADENQGAGGWGEGAEFQIWFWNLLCVDF